MNTGRRAMARTERLRAEGWLVCKRCSSLQHPDSFFNRDKQPRKTCQQCRNNRRAANRPEVYNRPSAPPPTYSADTKFDHTDWLRRPLL